MGKRYNINELNEQYSGKQFNWLTVIKFLIEDNRARCLCKCKCGNEKIVDINKLLHNKIKSCGCYKYSKEHAEQCKQWRLDNPEKVKQAEEKHKMWINNNPDKIAEIADIGTNLMQMLLTKVQ